MTLQGLWRWALRGRHGDRRPWTAAVWPVAAATVAVTLMRLFGLEHGLRLVQLTAFTPYLAIGFALLAVAVSLTRRPVATAATALAALCLAALVLPRATGSPAGLDGQPLIVMSINMRLGYADAHSIVELVRTAGVDVLALQEFSPDSQSHLQDAGIDDLLPFVEAHPEWGASGSALYSRLPMSGGGMRHASDPGFNQAYATLTLPGGGRVIVESVHPVPPISQTSVWEAGLRGQIRGDAPGLPRILAGDFNATLDHRSLRDLIATGYRDAADAVGAGLTPTWPFYGPRSTATPKITLDHILVPASFGVRSFRAVTVPRTDHRAIIATVQDPT